MLITIITQSSSAGVATALAAVNANTISLNQAAAMVIGMDIGTTATAALATIGGNVQARRTGFAHVIYNTFTALGAFLLLTPYMLLVEFISPGIRAAEPEMILVGFHTFFNLLGVLIALPFTNQFANLLIRLFPERGNPFTQHLDRSLLKEPGVAITTVTTSLWHVSSALLSELQQHLRDVSQTVDMSLLDDVSEAIGKLKEYLTDLSPRFQNSTQTHDYVACLHVLDHLRRIERRVLEQKRLNRCRDDQGLADLSDKLADLIDTLTTPPPLERTELDDQYQTLNRELKTAMREYRNFILSETSQGTLTTSQALRRMDTARTLRRIGYHIWRITHHLSKTDSISQMLK